MEKWYDKVNSMVFEGKGWKTRMLPVAPLNYKEGDPVVHLLIGDEDMCEDWDTLSEDLENKFYWWIEGDKLELPANELLKYLQDEKEENPNLKIVDVEEPRDKMKSGIYY